MSDGQSIGPGEYRNADISSSGFPIYNRNTLPGVRDVNRTDFGLRLVQARKHAGFSQSEVAKRTGIAQSTLAEAEKSGQGSSFTARIAAECGVDPHWLETGEGEMLSRPAGMETAYAVAPEKLRRIAVVGRGNGGAAPQTIWTDGDFPVGDTGEYGEGIASSDPNAFLIEVDGLSMIPKYTPGNFALVEPNSPIDIEDDVLVRLRTGETMIKILTSRRTGYAFASYNDTVVRYCRAEDVEWIYHVAYPVQRKKIKSRT